MDSSALLALSAFAVTSLYTPGPNNLLLASSGARFGFARSMPHLLGVAAGFPLMLLAVGMGLGAIFGAFPALATIMRWVGAGVMLWLAWRIGTARSLGAGEGRDRPFRFHEAIAFQWINPKAWSMAIGVASVHLSGAAGVWQTVLCAGVFLGFGLGSASIWTGFGAALRRLLTTPMALKIFNGLMGLLLAGFVFWTLLS